MNDPRGKDELIERIISEHRQLEQTLFYFEHTAGGEREASRRARVSPEELSQPGVIGDWSLSDLLAHVAQCERRFVEWVESAPQSQSIEAERPELDLSLLSLPEAQLDVPPEVVLEEFPRSFLKTLAAIQAIPEKDLFAHGTFPWTQYETLAEAIAASTYENYRWAAGHIRRWRGAQ